MAAGGGRSYSLQGSRCTRPRRRRRACAVLLARSRRERAVLWQRPRRPLQCTGHAVRTPDGRRAPPCRRYAFVSGPQHPPHIRPTSVGAYRGRPRLSQRACFGPARYVLACCKAITGPSNRCHPRIVRHWETYFCDRSSKEAQGRQQVLQVHALPPPATTTCQLWGLRGKTTKAVTSTSESHQRYFAAVQVLAMRLSHRIYAW